jgi:hypothetical protein
MNHPQPVVALEYPEQREYFAWKPGVIRIILFFQVE